MLKFNINEGTQYLDGKIDLERYPSNYKFLFRRHPKAKGVSVKDWWAKLPIKVKLAFVRNNIKHDIQNSRIPARNLFPIGELVKS